MIGGVLVVGVGAMVMVDTLEYRDGKVESTNADNETITEPQYSSVDTPTRLPLGAIVMLLGGSITLRSLEKLGGS